jgi:hypothetical protein
MQASAPAKRAVYKCRICKEPKKGHICTGSLETHQFAVTDKGDTDDTYNQHVYCQICMEQYSSDNIKTGPRGDRSCHFCCEKCFRQVLAMSNSSLYQCPWCRRRYRISQDPFKPKKPKMSQYEMEHIRRCEVMYDMMVRMRIIPAIYQMHT